MGLWLWVPDRARYARLSGTDEPELNKGRAEADNFIDRGSGSLTTCGYSEHAGNDRHEQHSIIAGLHRDWPSPWSRGFSTGLLRSAITILRLSGRDAARGMGDVAAFRRSTTAPQLLRCPQNTGFCSRRVPRHRHGARQARAHDASTRPSGTITGIGDRLGGAALGAAPRRPGRDLAGAGLRPASCRPTAQPAFLAGSQLRPLFSAAGKRGFRSLPPEAVAAIDRLKSSGIAARARHAFWRCARPYQGRRGWLKSGPSKTILRIRE